MNRDQAIEILLRCRFDETRAPDPVERDEALKVVSNDSDLSAWIVSHVQCQRYFRTAIRGVPPPEGLKEQILTEVRCAVGDPQSTFWKRPRVLFASVASLVMALAMLFVEPRQSEPDRSSGIAEFQLRMISSALRGYSMDIETKDIGKILQHLKELGAPSSITIPAKLSGSTPLGCALLKWRGERVSMICFSSANSGQPKNDLWLFVMARSSKDLKSIGGVPQLAKVNRAWTATWADQDLVYMLGIDGDEAALRQWL